MLRFGTYLLAMAVSFGAGAAVSSHDNAAEQRSYSMATNAAFRDGLFLGKLARQQRTSQHISRGRWSNDDDRTAFEQGYAAGYQSTM